MPSNGSDKPSSSSDAIVQGSLNPGDTGVDYVVHINNSGPIIAAPEILEARKIEKDNREREEYVKNQPLVNAIDAKITPVDLVELLIREIAEEISYLKWERHRISKKGGNITNQSVSRITALKQLAEILGKKIENARNEQLDLRSPRFQSVLNLWMNFLYESMQKSGLKDTDIDLVFNQMKADMIGWEQKLADLTSSQ